MAKKKKDPTAYELALDAFRVPVRFIDEAIRNWDAIAKEPGTFDLNRTVRIASIYCVLDLEFAEDIADQIILAYPGRFSGCVVSIQNSVYNGTPCATRFAFNAR